MMGLLDVPAAIGWVRSSSEERQKQKDAGDFVIDPEDVPVRCNHVETKEQEFPRVS